MTGKGISRRLFIGSPADETLGTFVSMRSALNNVEGKPCTERREFLGAPAVVASAAMQELLDQAERVGQSRAAVLITGESGSGKEILARAIHHYSPRAAQAWVDVNCGALPEHLVESELFGYEKGAFSGAMTAKPGLFELADKGTLFLDEIGELDLRLQTKLLRVLDNSPYYRLGGRHKIHVDVRIIAATNQDLAAAIQAGRFREDLFHRIGQVKMRVPPLRERQDDIVPLAEYFLAQQNPDLHLTKSAVASMHQYEWPGNVRELRNAMITAALSALGNFVSQAELTLESASRNQNGGEAPPLNLEELERQAIARALAQSGQHQERAAHLLGISSRTLRRKMRIYGFRAQGVTPLAGGGGELHGNVTS